MMSKLVLTREEVAFLLSSPGNDREICKFFVKVYDGYGGVFCGPNSIFK